MDKKEQILQIAKKLILKKGYSKVSVQEITSSLGISKGSFYTYFKSKADMIHEMIHQHILIMKEKRKKIFLESVSLEECLRKTLWSRFEKNESVLEVELVILNLFKNMEVVEEDIVNRLLDLEKEHRECWKEELKKYQKDLSIPEEEREDYAYLMSRMIQGFTISNLFATEDHRFFINDIQDVIARMETENVEKKIEFLIKNIMKMLQ